MSSRSYNLAFDNPYNRKIADVLRKYEARSDTNGEPDLLHYTNSRLTGGSMEPMEFKHPHLLHMSQGEMPYTPLPRPLRRYADVSIGSGRPAGMVSPYVEAVDPKSIIDAGTSAVYPIYNALEMKAVGGCRCNCPMVAEVIGSGKKKKSVGKVVLKEVVPIVKDIGVMAIKELTKEAIKSAFKQNKSGSGRRRKKMTTQMELEPNPDEMSIAIIDEGGMMMEMTDKRSGKEKKEGSKKLQKLTKKVFTGGVKGGKAVRAEIVKKIMKEKGMKMIEASKYVKEKGLY
jgi:hypothetical protein